jgi:hypothetical protein
VPADLPYNVVAGLIGEFGNYRTEAAQKAARLAEVPGVDGALLIAFGLRETGLRNIEGGAKLVDGRWVKQDDPKLMDVGWTQISRHWHAKELATMPGVAAGTWAPHVAGKTANDKGFCPRFKEATDHTVRELADAVQFATDKKVPTAAHTAGGDYSAWVLRHRLLVLDFFKAHPGWVA